MKARVWDVSIDGESIKLEVGQSWFVVIPDTQLGMREVVLAVIITRSERTVELEWDGYVDGEPAEGIKARLRIDDVEWVEKCSDAHPSAT